MESKEEQYHLILVLNCQTSFSHVHCAMFSSVMLRFVMRRCKKYSYDMIIVTVKPYIAVNKNLNDMEICDQRFTT
jgi:hypothetical protein